jgi:hypothetical protein
MIERTPTRRRGTPVVTVTGKGSGLTLHHARHGHSNVVVSTVRAEPEEDAIQTRRNILAAMPPAEARAFAMAILDAADEIDYDGSPDREYDRVLADPAARGRFREGMSIARSIFRPASPLV